MNNWIDRAFIISDMPRTREAEYEDNGYSRLGIHTAGIYAEYINKFNVYIDGTLITVTRTDEVVDFFVVYPDPDTLKFVKDVVIAEIYNDLNEYLQFGKISDLYIPDIVKQVVPVSSRRPNINVTYMYPGLDFEGNSNHNHNQDFWAHQKVTQKFMISVRFDKLVCTFNHSLYLYNLTHNDGKQIKTEIRNFVRPVVNILTFLNENPTNVEEALDLIANINFITHSAIFPVIRTVRALNGFIKFCKAFPCEKTFEEACQEVVGHDNFFKKVLGIKRTRDYIRDNGKNLIYSKYGINVTPVGRSIEFRIWTQRMETSLNSIRSLGVILIMFGEFEQFKADVERTLLRNA